MDEKGIILGISPHTMVFVNCDQKSAYNIEKDTSEMVTIIETICADSSAILPCVIFKDDKIQASWCASNPANAR